MKKLWLAFLCMAVAVLGLVGCSTDKAPATQEAKMKVVTTVYPVYDVVKKVGGDHIDLHLLVPPGAEPHDWEPSAQDLKEISTAKVFFYSGAGLEPTEQLLKKEVLGETVAVELSHGLDLIAAEHEDEDHDHDHEHHHHDHDGVKEDHHDHEHEHHHHHHHGQFDPHVWLDPMNVAAEVDVVVDALAKADPAHKDAYIENGKKYKEELSALDKEMSEKLATVPNRHLIVSHEAFAYLAKRYGFEQIGIMGVDADAEPTPERMAQIVDFVRDHQVHTIYSEELISPKLAEAIAKEAGAKVMVLNPIEGLTEEQVKAGADYLSLQRENLKTLLEGQQQ